MHFTFKLRDQLEGSSPSTYQKGGGSGGSSSGTYGAGMTPAESQALATVSGGSPIPNAPYPTATTPYAATGMLPSNPYQQASMAQQGALAGTVMAGMYQPQQVQTRFNAPMVGTSGFTPTVGTGGTTPSVTAGQLSGANIAQYQNPYTQQVIDAAAADTLRNAQIGLNQLGTEASRAGAFGGSRHGVAMGEMGRGVAQMLGQQAAGLRQAGFQNAQQAAQFDIGTGMQAQQANQQAAANDLARRLQAQGMNQTAALQVAQRQLQAGQLNQSAIQQAQQMGLQGQQLNQAAGLQGAAFNLGAAGQLANLGQQSFGYGQAVNQGLQQQGAQQQALQQALIDSAKAQFAGYTAHPATTIGYTSAALGATPVAMQSQQTRQPGLFDYLTLAATAAGGK
jgi:hypothetical protein